MTTTFIFEVGIAVDFGMTGSAVAWNESRRPEEINAIDYWPGGNGKKVPTKISLDQIGEVVSWGFLSDSDSIHTRELFKVFLDSTIFESSDQKKLSEPRPRDSNEVAKWSHLYLRSLIEYALTSIGNTLHEKLNIPGAKVQLLAHFVLTIPTTWNADIITTYRFIAERAICDASNNHTYASSLKSVDVSITESEALANYFLDQKTFSLSYGDYFLVMDVGGSTSDFCFCQVAEIYGHHICLVLNHEAPIRGISYGCVDIDRHFETRVTEQLDGKVGLDRSIFAVQMRRSNEFREVKSSYSGLERDVREFSIRIPGWSKITLEQAQIFHGRMIFTEFNVLLDQSLVDRLKGHVSEVLKLAPGPLKMVALGGGGSHMPYIRNSMRHIAPVFPVLKLEAVALGCLVKWNKQLLLMTLIVWDSPVRKLAIGTSQRTAGVDVITHTWRKNTTHVKHTTLCYTIGQDISPNQSWQKWYITIDNAKLAPATSTAAATTTIRVDIRLPKIRPYLCDGDFKVYSTQGTEVPFDVKESSVPYSG